jgi:glycosyltransferase involved in cell wall biosynthesis
VWLAGPAERDFSKTVRDLRLPFHATPAEGPLKLRFILSAARAIRKWRIELVHGHHGRDLWPTILAAKLSRAHPKVVLTRHLAKSPSSWVSRRFLLDQCDAIIAVSHFVARVLREGVYEPNSPEPERRARPPLLGNYSKINVIHGGIDADRFRPFDARIQREAWGLAPEHFAFGVVGGYDRPRGKGQIEFLRAAVQVQTKLPHARFLIVGRGELKALLEAEIAELKLEGKAWLTPYSTDMPAAMNALDCLVHPQVGTEAFPGVVLEAFACGKPVIASALDGIPEGFAVGQCGRLVQPEDIEGLAAAFVEQTRGPGLTLAERDALHERVASEYSLIVRAGIVLRLYQRLLGSSSSGGYCSAESSQPPPP